MAKVAVTVNWRRSLVLPSESWNIDFSELNNSYVLS